MREEEREREKREAYRESKRRRGTVSKRSLLKF